MTRTDIHSPSNFDPAAYTYVGSFDAWRDYRLVGPPAEEETRVKRILEAGSICGNFATRGTCDHCGARCRYIVVFSHENGDVIATGEQCAAERFEHSSRFSYDVAALRRLVALHAERARTHDAASEWVSEQDETLRVAFDEGTDLAAEFGLNGYGLSTVTDIRNKVWQYGNVSEKAAAFALKLIREQAQRNARVVAPAEATRPAPVGRVNFEGVVIKRTVSEGDFGTYVKLVIKVQVGTTPEGAPVVFLVHVTEPNSIRTTRGDIVAMKATLTRSDRPGSEHFAFGSRPSDARIVGRQEDLPEVDALAD